MFASFEYQLTKDEYVRGLRIVSTAVAFQDRYRNVRPLGQLAIYGMMIGVAALLDRTSVQPVFLTIAALLLIGCVRQGRLLRYWHGLTYDPTQSRISLTMDDAGVARQAEGVEQRWSWDVLRQVHELPEMIVLQFADWHVLNLPARLWPEQSEKVEFVRQVREHSPKLRPDLPLQARRSKDVINLLSVGAFAAAIGSMILMSLLSGHALLLMLPSLEVLPNRVEIISAAIVIVSIITALVTGRSAKIGLDKLDQSHPRTAAGISIALMTALVAAITTVVLIRSCRC